MLIHKLILDSLLQLRILMLRRLVLNLFHTQLWQYLPRLFVFEWLRLPLSHLIPIPIDFRPVPWLGCLRSLFAFWGNICFRPFCYCFYHLILWFLCLRNFRLLLSFLLRLRLVLICQWLCNYCLLLYYLSNNITISLSLFCSFFLKFFLLFLLNWLLLFPKRVFFWRKINIVHLRCSRINMMMAFLIGDLILMQFIGQTAYFLLFIEH